MTDRPLPPRGEVGEVTAEVGEVTAEAGQAAVELALLLPVVVLLGLVLVQATLVLRDQLLVVHAAREAARATSLDPDPGRARTAAEAVLSGAVVHLRRRPPVGEMAAVEVRYRSPTAVPVVGPLVPDAELSARAVMQVER